jgi:thymidylate kinase
MKMFSVALVGPDGSGKTSIARRLEQSWPGRFKYLYMGVNTGSSNVKLPTSRVAERVKSVIERPQPSGDFTADEKIRPASRGKLWSALRLTNRLAEEVYHLMLSSWYVRRGFIVVHDRHYKFDFACDQMKLRSMRMSDRLHRLWLSKLYPYPDVILFLDAAPEVLFARKHEGTLEWLAERQHAILHLGESAPNFIRIDGSKPLDQVYSEVERHILSFCECGNLTAKQVQAG